MATRETTGAQREHAWEGRQQTRDNGHLRQEVGRARHPAYGGILGAVVFVLAAIASTQTAKSDTRPNQT
jgi:hypothetical protein